MKRTFLAVLAVLMVLTLTGCGSNNNDSTPVFVTSIFSDPFFDGDIQVAPSGALINITQAVNTQNVFAGLDPVTGDEFRAFLDFPLSGVNGVPGNAIIESAFLDIFINNIDMQFPATTIPMRIDLVSFQPPALIESDFDRPAILTNTVPLFLSDLRSHVTIDVTSLMIEAQRLGLVDFQVRIMEDCGFVAPGLIEINDTTGIDRNTLAPLLTVTYF